jgi:hypothetical protein
MVINVDQQAAVNENSDVSMDESASVAATLKDEHVDHYLTIAAATTADTVFSTANKKRASFVNA